MDNHFDSSRTLFDRYLKNECTPDEVRQLIRYFGTAEREEGLRSLVSSALLTESADQPGTDEAVREVYSTLMEKIAPAEAESETQVRSMPLFSRMAAVWIALIVSAGAAVYFFSKDSAHTGSHENAITTLTSETKTGERKKVVLDDGTVVWLNAMSKLSFPKQFSDGPREVALEGEAYFEVFRDAKRPFLIHSGDIETKVLGTSFDVKAYDDDRIVSVTVLTGRVEVKALRSGQPVVLAPDQQVVYDKSGGTMRRGEINAEAVLAWRDGRMQFRNAVLDDVVATLRRSYDVTINYDPQLGKCPVYADFEANTPVSKVLEMLAVSLNGKITEVKDKNFRLEGDGCHQKY